MHLEFWIFFSAFWKLYFPHKDKFHIWSELQDLMWRPWVVQAVPSRRCETFISIQRGFSLQLFWFEQHLPLILFFTATVDIELDTVTQLQFGRLSLTQTPITTACKTKMWLWNMAWGNPCHPVRVLFAKTKTWAVNSMHLILLLLRHIWKHGSIFWFHILWRSRLRTSWFHLLWSPRLCCSWLTTVKNPLAPLP